MVCGCKSTQRHATAPQQCHSLSSINASTKQAAGPHRLKFSLPLVLKHRLHFAQAHPCYLSLYQILRKDLLRPFPAVHSNSTCSCKAAHLHDDRRILYRLLHDMIQELATGDGHATPSCLLLPMASMQREGLAGHNCWGKSCQTDAQQHCFHMLVLASGHRIHAAGKKVYSMCYRRKENSLLPSLKPHR